ncbi:hypothetical protein GCM10011320_56650 [Neoroseomonas lacus]|uniref:Uncharacterized protein n=2 Tax=Neoroseomonas lacus TaxID=287609 RepID=A0A917L4I6_9PROT|nr:hypothetical protein GCM10011320_56650 [Neoroseomonas lacus]
MPCHASAGSDDATVRMQLDGVMKNAPTPAGQYGAGAADCFWEGRNFNPPIDTR